MKAEEMAKKCPECKCQDKKISKIKKPRADKGVLFISHIPKEGVGVIRCSECGHIFEYCAECKSDLEVKKICI